MGKVFSARRSVKRPKIPSSSAVLGTFQRTKCVIDAGLALRYAQKAERVHQSWPKPVCVKDQATWKRSTPRAGARGGARAGRPRWVRIRTITGGSSMAAMIFKRPPHWGQCSISMSKTRLSKRAQLIRVGVPCACSAECPVEFSSGPGMISERNFALGASTPSKREVYGVHGVIPTFFDVRVNDSECNVPSSSEENLAGSARKHTELLGQPPVCPGSVRDFRLLLLRIFYLG